MLTNTNFIVCQQELRGAAVTVEEWKQAVQHAQSMIKSEERKAAAQRARYKRRLVTLEVESDRLRVSAMEAEAQVKAVAWSDKKVRVRVWLKVRVRVRVRVRVWVRVHQSLFCFAALIVRTGCL
jgi:hypothetical protein